MLTKDEQRLKRASSCARTPCFPSRPGIVSQVVAEEHDENSYRVTPRELNAISGASEAGGMPLRFRLSDQ